MLSAQLALPDHANTPSHLSKGVDRISITLDVGCELGRPEPLVRCRCRRESTAGVAVPEATVNEDHGAMTREHQVWTARQVTAMQAESQPLREQQTAQSTLRHRVLVANGAHHAAARLPINNVRHSPPAHTSLIASLFSDISYPPE